MKKLYILDYMNLTSRMYWAFEKYGLQNQRGEPTSALFGMCGFVIELLKSEKPDYIVVAKESSDGNSWRKDLFAGYKANRKAKEPNMVAQFPEIDRFFNLLGIPLLSAPGNEADDVVGSLVHQYQEKVDCVIVSSDKDFMQLISPKTIMYIPQNGGGYKLAGENEVLQKFSCRPEQVGEVLAIMGDSVDCVPGAKGIGPKGAAQLVQQYGTVDNIYANLPSIKKAHATKLQSSESDVLISRKLVDLNKTIDLGITLEDMVSKPLPGKEVFDFLMSHNMNSVASNYFDQVWPQLNED